MPDSLDLKFSEYYTPKINQFISLIEGENLKNLPEPFLPVYGKGYCDSPARIMFMGWETRGGRDLKEFVETAKKELNSALYWMSDDFEFRWWKSNFGSDFWTFNLKFLAKFHGMNNWKDFLYNYTGEQHEHILNSFAWANCDAIERFEVTAQKQGVLKEDWQKVKNASEIFDSPQLIFKALKPDLVILEYWHKEEDWLLNGIKVITESEPHPYLWHYNCLIDEKPMQLFWTHHPRAMPNKEIEYDTLIDEIISIYNSNKS